MAAVSTPLAPALGSVRFSTGASDVPVSDAAAVPVPTVLMDMTGGSPVMSVGRIATRDPDRSRPNARSCRCSGRVEDDRPVGRGRDRRAGHRVHVEQVGDLGAAGAGRPQVSTAPGMTRPPEVRVKSAEVAPYMLRATVVSPVVG